MYLLKLCNSYTKVTLLYICAISKHGHSGSVVAIVAKFASDYPSRREEIIRNRRVISIPQWVHAQLIVKDKLYKT